MTNSVHFVPTISSETILDNEIMVSFDEVSQFTNASIDAAAQAALQKLEEDPSLGDRSRNATVTTGEPYDSVPPREQHTETARIEMH